MRPLSTVGEILPTKDDFTNDRYICLELKFKSQDNFTALLESRSKPKSYMIVRSGITNMAFPTYKQAINYFDKF